VHRNLFMPSEKALDRINWLHKRMREMGTAFLEETADSPFSSLTSRLLEIPPVAGPAYWAHVDPAEPELPKWKPVGFPCISSSSYSYAPLPKEVTVNGQPVSILRTLGGVNDHEHYEGPQWSSQFEPGDRLIAGGSSTVSEFWTRPPKIYASPRPIGNVCRFPPPWHSLAGARTYFSSQWSESHPLVKIVTDKAYLSLPKAGMDPLRYKERLLADRAFAAAWVMKTLANGESDVWLSIRDRDPEFLEKIWRDLLGRRISHVAFVVNEFLHVASPSDWLQIDRNDSKWSEFLPDPGPEWTLVEKKAGQRTRKQR